MIIDVFDGAHRVAVKEGQEFELAEGIYARVLSIQDNPPTPDVNDDLTPDELADGMAFGEQE